MAAVMITSTLPTAVFAVDETEEPAGGTVENFVGSDGEHDGEGYGDYVLENTETIPERADDDYEGTLTLVVTNNADGNVVTGVSLDEPAQTVTINADESTTVSFTVAIQGADVTVATEKHYADKDADEHFADKDATKHYAKKEAEKHYSDAEATQQYNEKYLYKEDIKLGNETDADGKYAVKDN